jgi:hypothetical protein
MSERRTGTVQGVRGVKIKISPPPPTAPVIAKIDGSKFRITWLRVKPAAWAVQAQGEPDGEWDIATVVSGSQTIVTLSGSPYQVRIVGRDAEHNPVTDVSNVIVLNVPVVPVTNIVLTYDGSFDVASWTFDGDQPQQWEIQYSQDGGTTWPTNEFLPGNGTNTAPSLEPGKMRVRAANADNSPASDFSNVVDVG